MKRFFLLYLFLAVGFIGKTQSILSAHFRVSGSTHQIRSAKLVVDNVEFEISGDGEIIGFDYLPGGEITYYGIGTFDREGKIKSIGGVPIDYYDRFGLDEKLGKLKSIGNITVDYFDRFGEDSKKGKLKSIGNIQFDYNGTFDDDELLGKLKKVGNYNITYYNRFSANELLGKVKTVGPVSLQYSNNYAARNKATVSIQGNTRAVYVTVW